MAAPYPSSSFSFSDEEEEEDDDALRDAHYPTDVHSRGADDFDFAYAAEPDLHAEDSNRSGGAAATPAATAAATPAAAGRYFHFGVNKAGMQSVDRAAINKIIEDASKGSAYYAKALRTDARLQEQVRNVKAKVDSLTQEEMQFGRVAVEKLLADLERTRDLTRVWVVVDFDAFFAAVEERDFPELRGKPLAIGPGLISTTNYLARRFGVRSAMPEFIGRKLCPSLIVRPLRFEAYKQVAEVASGVYAKFDASYSSFSLDEAYLNFNAYLEKHPGTSPEEAVALMRRELYEATKLTVSAGIASTPMLAKICADVNKPNGQYMLPPTREAVVSFLKDLAIRRVPGIGKQTEALLNGAFGVCTVGDLFQRRVEIQRVLRPLQAEFLLRASLGVTDVDSVRAPFADAGTERKSISVERTFRSLSNPAAIFEKLAHVCSSLAQDVAEKCLCGRTVTLKIKTASFDVRSRSVSLSAVLGGSSVVGEDFFRVVEPLMLAELPCDLRLIGVRLSKLERAPSAKEGQHVKKQQLLTDVFRELEELGAQCPVCNCRVKVANNDELNRHIDGCLNAGLVRELAQDPQPHPKVKLRPQSQRVGGGGGGSVSGTIDGFFKTKLG